jgi:hypothetical protein
MSELRPVPTWIKVMLVIQFLIALLILTMGWSHTRSMGFGRTPSLIDTLSLATPLVLVVLLGAAAIRAAKSGNSGAAGALALAPLPLALILALLAGMIV